MSTSRTDAPEPAADPEPAPPAEKGLGRRFWVLFSSSSTSNLADGVGKVALPLLAVSLTRDPVLVGALSSLTFLPWVLFAIVSGALVDRLDRRRAMIAAQLVRAAVVGLLAAAVMTGQAALWMLYVAAFALGAVETLYDNAVHAMTPLVVRRDQLEKANGRIHTAIVVADSFLGAPLGSALFVALAALPFLANSLGFLLAGALLLLLPGNYRADRNGDGPANLRAEMAEGVRWLWNHRLLRGITLIVALAAGAFNAVMAMLVLFVVDLLDLPPATFGWFLLAAAVGGVTGGLVAAPLARRLPRPLVMAAGTGVPAVTFVLIGTFPSVPMLAVACTVGAIGTVVSNVVTMSVRQALIPPHLFGRVLGAIRTVLWALMPVGALAGGLVAGTFGLRTLAVAGGVAMLVLVVPLMLILHRHRTLLDTLNSPDTVDT
ncbi:MFS transporter [Planomonospora venezuelensis]|uniref:MFS family permease n=1 Tax=Planomonospora venezuelensis TaxID=1999 RepID=A0A841D3M8_PLAVE|nr:MFS transporter [Planomonospora venezuelensis]MBB5964851.1 MFS family permease [Planomonospora venezuelensis]GIM62324.1 MFS transporter [Planomonospora venezuelensis]